MDPELKQNLIELAGRAISFDAPLSHMTSFGLGGKATVLVEPNSVETLASVMDLIRAEALPWFILGGGNNVLIRDEGFEGVVIRLGSSFSQIKVEHIRREKYRIEAGATASIGRLVTVCREQGLSGLEFLAGIPGWVGGALAMNAGIPGMEITNAVAGIEILDAEGQLVVIDQQEIKAGYRSLTLPEAAIILKGVFSVSKTDPAKVGAAMDELLLRRKERQPLGVKSAGCVFKNPPGESAGWLIDQAGLKGRRMGKAWVAEEHANFIVHKGGATATDILTLIDLIQRSVEQKFKITLEPEIKILGSRSGGRLG